MEHILLGYLSEFSKSFLAIVATILPIMNPPSGAAMFLSVTNGASVKTRHILAKNVARNCFLMLIAFLFLGSFVLKFFGISKEIVLIGGGLLVVKMGWGLLNADNNPPKQGEQPPDMQTPEKLLQTAFFPISFPMTVGPGTLAACLTVGVSMTGVLADLTFAQMVARLLGSLMGIVALALTVRICYGYAEKFMTILGETGAVVFLRICAFILLCIGIQLIWDGLSSSIINLYNALQSSTPMA
ncbi:MAG: MarC family protein [Saezia sp.]